MIRFNFREQLWESLGFWNTLRWLAAQNDVNEREIRHEILRHFHAEEEGAA